MYVTTGEQNSMQTVRVVNHNSQSIAVTGVICKMNAFSSELFHQRSISSGRFWSLMGYGFDCSLQLAVLHD